MQNKDETIDIMSTVIGKNYDLEVLKNKSELNYVGFGKRDLSNAYLRRYFNVKLVNINGLGTGQVHFITEDGSYLLLPWCYIISMIPSVDKTSNE